MTNKPKLSVERELLERVADNRYRDKERISIALNEPHERQDTVPPLR